MTDTEITALGKQKETITQEEIEKAAKKYALSIGDSCFSEQDIANAFYAGAEYAMLNKATTANHWRDPKVELPEECESVLVHCEGFYTIAYFNGVEWHGNRYLKVLHWMPIPEPPKPEGK